MDISPGPGAPLLASACLLGLRCRHDGGSKPHTILMEWARRGRVIAVCPEQLGGLPTPRPAAELESGEGADVLAGRDRVLDGEGADLSAAFQRGATEALGLARLYGCRLAVLKERSPSCGVCELASAGGDRPGRGVTTALLAAEGLEVISDEAEGLARRLEESLDAQD